jgi:hypothetical protein
VEQHRITVRRGALYIDAADRAVAAGTVFDNELNVALRRDFRRDQPDKSVDTAPGETGTMIRIARSGKPDSARAMCGASRVLAPASIDAIAERRFIIAARR